MGDFALCVKQKLVVPPEAGLCPKRPGVKWASEGGKSVGVETVLGGLIMLEGLYASGGEEFW